MNLLIRSLPGLEIVIACFAVNMAARNHTSYACIRLYFRINVRISSFCVVLGGKAVEGRIQIRRGELPKVVAGSAPKWRKRYSAELVTSWNMSLIVSLINYSNVMSCYHPSAVSSFLYDVLPMFSASDWFLKSRSLSSHEWTLHWLHGPCQVCLSIFFLVLPLLFSLLICI